MNPISSVNAGLTPHQPQAAPAPVRGADIGGATGSGSVLASSSASATTATSMVSQVQSTLSQLLQMVGSGMEGNQTLKTLFALMIILAMLQDMEKNSGSGQGALEQLGSGLSGRGQYIEMYSSSTTISIEQTTTMTTVGGVDALGGAAGGDASAGQGGTIDVAV